MIETPAIAEDDPLDEIAALVRTLHETQQRLQELAGGEVDAVVHPGGQSYLLHQAQEKLRCSETAQHDLAATQSSILNALPAHIALLDHAGTILSVNDGWRHFAESNGLQDSAASVGRNYLEICDRAHGACAVEAQAAADGIRAILAGVTGEFALEYPCHSPTEQRWFQLRVNPIEDGVPRGAVIMHVNITARKLAEEELRWKTAFLEAQVAASLDGVLVVDPRGKKILQNQRLNDLLKIPRSIADDPDDRQQLRWVTDTVRNSELFFARVAHLNSHPDESGRDEIELKDGTFLDRYSAPVAGQGQEYYGRIWTFRDITERKRTEEAARQHMRLVALEAEVRLALLRRETLPETLQWCCEAIVQYLDGAFARIWMLNERAQMLELQASAGLYTHLDGPHGRVPVGQFKIGLIAEERKPHLTNQVVGDPRVGDQEWARREGMVAFAGYPLLVQDRLIGVVAMFARHPLTEVTITALAAIASHIAVGIERKQAEREAHLNEQRYRSLVEATTAIVWDTPASGEFEVAQSGWSAFTGQTFGEYRGWGWLQAIHPDDQKETASVWTAAVASRSIYQVEHRLRAHDGIYRDMVVRAVPILAEDGTIVQWVGIHTDITERKKMEQQILRSQRMESIGTLAGGIAHDLNNVLGPIIMALDLLNTRFPDRESQELISIINSSAQRGADMVRQVLSFGRGVEGRRMEVQIKHLVREIEKIANDTFLKHIRIRTVLPHDLWMVSGDPTQLHQVLLNLCVNARDAMPDGGTLTISAENVTLDAQYAGMNLEAQAGPYVALHVEDTGMGMEPGVMEKIFDPFFTTKELGKGTGLGLSTTLAIIKSHGGFIRTYSEPRKGTKFRVYLPGRTETSPEAAATREAEMPRGHNEMILVVDDEPSVREITSQTLQLYGYRVLLASDGAEAVALYASRQAEIAAVLTDMMMPGIDGPATIQILRKLNPKLPIIAASGLSNDGQLAKIASLGVKHFLPKPYTAETLLKTLKQVLTTGI
jgi:PAS domain S-box-containing protein